MRTRDTLMSHEQEKHAVRRFFDRPPLRFLCVDPPTGVPRAFWQHIRLARYVLGAAVSFLAVVTGACIVQFALLISGRSPIAWLSSAVPIMAAVLSGCIALIVVIPRIVKSRFRKHIEARDYELCLECGYLLRGLGSAYTCPECGSSFSLEDVRQRWIDWLESDD